MLPPSYNDILQIFQTPDNVVIFQEMSNNNPRIVPMDGRPHLPHTIRLWPGDSRGHWEGDTLVVETTNFTEKADIIGIFAFVDPARHCVWSSGSHVSMPIRSTTSSRSKIPRHGQAHGSQKSR